MLTHLTPGQTTPVIPRILSLTLVRNPGVAFGFFRDHNNIALSLVITGCILLVLIMLKIRFISRIQQVACGMMIGGAIGNIVDRIHYGAVIDFIDVHVWPVFNIADSFISLAACFFIISLFRRRM